MTSSHPESYVDAWPAERVQPAEDQPTPKPALTMNPHPPEYPEAQPAEGRSQISVKTPDKIQDGSVQAEVKADSATTPQPPGYLEARLAGETRVSSTNPFRESDLEARRLAESDISPESLPIPSIQNLSLDEIPNNVRAVVNPTVDCPNQDQSITTFRIPQTSKDVLIVRQTSMFPGFCLRFDNHEFRCAYDVGSDDLVIRNLNHQPYIFKPFELDKDESMHNDPVTLDSLAICTVPPGSWKLHSANGEVLADLLLLHRRFVAEKRVSNSAETGSKRAASPDTRPTKRLHSGDKGVVVFDNSPEAPTETPFSLVKAGNPLEILGKGESIAIKSSCPAKTQETEDDSSVPSAIDDYTISHVRDIAVHQGISTVYRGTHSRLGDVVVKVIRRKDPTPPSYAFMFAREWMTEVHFLKKVSHPSIIKYHHADARFYSIYMDYLPHPDLASYRDRQNGHFFTGDLHEAKKVLHDIASALEYLYDQAIIHNDIKPSNIIYGRGHSPILIDFGLASTRGSRPCLGGTPWYVPVDLINNHRGTRSDVFALGVTMLFLLKKIPLPDVTEKSWRIDRLQEPSEFTVMSKWMDKLNNICAQLDSSASSLELIVKETVAMDEGERLSARRILKRLEAIGEQVAPVETEE